VTTTISNGTTTIVPDIMDGFDSTREVQSILIPIIGRADPDVVLRPAGSRSGTLNLVFAVEAASVAAELAFATPVITPWTLADTDAASVGFKFVVGEGSIVRELESETRAGWIVRVPYREVPA
jgi:hypothetical protein